MASFCRGFRQALRCRGSRSFAHRFPLSVDLPDLKPTFESPPLFESYLSGNKNSDHIIHDQIRWANGNPSVPMDKLLRFVKSNAVKRKIPEASVSYQKLFKHCLNFTEKLSEDERKYIIKMLERSGEILKFGQTAHPQPLQAERSVQNDLPRLIDERSSEELRKMENEMEEIEKKSESVARKELWCGLGFFAVQTIGLFRLTFWELSWDIMEPICFYLTSLYFMLGYAFFLRTLREPSFENLYAARVAINRRKLMKRRKFDLQRYRDLQKICRPPDESAFDVQRKVFS